MIPEIHFVRIAREKKCPKWYLYAWRGGPQIMTAEGFDRPKLSEAAIQLVASLRAERNAADGRTLGGLVASYRANPEWRNLASSTRRTWGGALDLIEDKWGKTPLTVWSDPRMRAKVVAWRDSRSGTPRGADIGVTVLSRLLEFAFLRGVIDRNVATGIPHLYRGGGRALIIWTDDEMDLFISKARELEQGHIADGLRLAALTGLRRQDLVSATFDHVDDKVITLMASKQSKGRRFRVTIPMVPELDELVTELRSRFRKPGVNTLLVNSFGQSWSPSGFTGSFNRVRDAVGIFGEDEGGQKTPKHLHDLRGTFCTKLCETGMTNDEIATVMGWSVEQVAGIRRTYVDQDRIVVAIAQRMTRHV